MSDESNKLLEGLMQALGDNPAETLGQMLSTLSEKQTEAGESSHTESVSDSTPNLDMMMQLGGLMSQLGSQTTDERSALLYALKPFLSEERKPQIDRAIKLLKLSQLAKAAKNLDLLSNLL